MLIVWSLANSNSGRERIEALIGRFSGGTVQVSGWTGHFPDRFHFDQITLRDPEGIWCTISQADLDWTPRALLARTAQIDRLAIGRLDLPRLAEPSTKPAKPSTASGPTSLPVTIDLRSAEIGAAHIGAPLAGQDVAIGRITLNAAVSGSTAKPTVQAALTIAGFASGQEKFSTLDAKAHGENGAIVLNSSVFGLMIPGPQPAFLQSAPVQLHVETDLAKSNQPVAVAVRHPLLQLDGTMESEAGVSTGAAHLHLPDLRPFAEIGGLDLSGHTDIQANVRLKDGVTDLSVNGSLGILGGLAPVPALVGPTAIFSIAGKLDGQKITIANAQFKGRTIDLHADGTETNNLTGLKGTLALSDLSAIRPEVHGAVKADFDATGLPTSPSGTVDLSGMVDGGPVTLHVSGERQKSGEIGVKITNAAWKNSEAQGQLTLYPGAAVPVGDLTLKAGRLADFDRLSGQKLSGSLVAAVQTKRIGETPIVSIRAEMHQAGIPTASVGNALLAGTVSDPLAHPSIDASLKADGIKASGAAGNAALTVKGVMTRLAVNATADLHGSTQAHLAADTVLNIQDRQASIDRLEASWHGEMLRLQGAAGIRFGKIIGVDHLKATIGSASIEADGDVSPSLKLRAAIKNVTPALAAPFVPSLHASGVISADAILSGPPAAPQGTLHLTGTGLRYLDGAARSLPAANIGLQAALDGKQAKIDLKADAGSQTHLSVNGTAPLAATGNVALHTEGHVDLTLLDPILTPDGRRARGQIAINLSANGALPRPVLDGTITLSGGEIQDFAQGVHITGLNGTIRAKSGELTIEHFIGQAGKGTIGVDGATSPLDPTVPIAINVHFDHARPLASDLLTADLSGDMHVHGAVQGTLTASGTINVDKATINLPERMPSSIAVLPIKRPGDAAAPPPAPSKPITLDVTVNAGPTALFVRGHGLDAVLGGKLKVGGTSATPTVNGGFRMQHGTFSLAGTTLNFMRGIVSFNGSSASGKIDPSLDFEADNNSAGTIAKLLVTGYASAPKISLASEPPIPQDEILARLLFGVGTQQLGPVQIATIAEALASLSGLSSGPGILDRIRGGLGLDRLSVGSGSGNSISNSIPNLNQRETGNTSTVNTSVEAGRYVAPGVYVGGKQNTTGNGTQAEVQVDLTKRLKLETDMGTGPGANTVGLTYQFQY